MNTACRFTRNLALAALLAMGFSRGAHAQYTSTPNSAGGVDISGTGTDLGPLNQSTDPALSTHGEDNITIREFSTPGFSGTVFTLQTSGNTLTNDGGIDGTGNHGVAIDIASGEYDSILNNSDGFITGFQFAITVGGNNTTVTNYGTITSDSESGIFVASSLNTINNKGGGTITGYLDGILLNSGQSNTVNNDGTISSSHGTGIEIDTSSNTVTNTGTVQGNYDGIAIVNENMEVSVASPGNTDSAVTAVMDSDAVDGNTITNSGLINGAGAYGIFMLSTQNTNVQNNLAAIISGSSSGIDINGGMSNTVTNEGKIKGANLDGIDINNAISTSINNQLFGQIQGQMDGIDVKGGDFNSITNNGGIVGTSGDGIYFHNTTGNITNATFGTITGADNGIEVDGGSDENIVNSNQIKGRTGSGIYLQAGGSKIENNQGGTISGSTSAVVIAGGSNTVTNDGLFSSKGDGIDLGNFALNTVNNHSTGVIEGGSDGIHIDGGVADTIVNDGQVKATAGSGIYLNDTLNQITNSIGASITGLYGITIDGGSLNTITNNGTITGKALTGIVETNATSNTIQNNFTGSITGAIYAIQISGNYNIINNEGLLQGSAGSVNITGNNNILNENGHGIAPGKITMSGTGNTVNFNLTGLSPAKITNINNLLIPQGVNSGLPSATVVFTLNGVTYDIDPAIVKFHASSYQLQGATPNEQAVGASLDSLNSIPGPQLLALFNAIDTSGNVPLALGQLSPQAYQILGDLAIVHSDYLVSSIDSRLNNVRDGSESIDTSGVGGETVAGLTKDESHDGKSGKEIVHASAAPDRWGFFATGDGLFFRGDQRNTGLDNKSNSAGTLIGVDGKVGDKGVIGALFSYDNTSAQLGNAGSHANIESYSGGVYGSYHDGGLYFNSLAAYTRNDYNTTRNIAIGGLGAAANGSTDGNQETVNLDGGYDWNATDRISVGPILGAQYVHLNIDGFSETGLPGAGLNVGSQDINSLQSRLGAHANYHLATSKNSSVAFDLHAAWQHEYLDDSRALGASFETPGLTPFAVQSGSPKRDAALVGLGANATFHDRMTLFVDYDLEMWSSSTFDQTINGGVRISF